MRERLCEEIHAHMAELVEQHIDRGLSADEAARTACRRIGDPRSLALSCIRADANTPFYLDSLCMRSLGATAIGFAMPVFAVLLVLFVQQTIFASIPIAGLDLLKEWSGFLRACAGALFGAVAYMLYLRAGGNPARTAPFMIASAIIVAVLLPLRLELQAPSQLSGENWQAMAFIDLPMLTDDGWVLRSGVVSLSGTGLGFPERARLGGAAASLSFDTAVSFIAVLVTALIGSVGILRWRAIACGV